MQCWLFKLNLKINHVMEDTELPMFVSEFMSLKLRQSR